jgi:hypothetical protein
MKTNFRSASHKYSHLTLEKSLFVPNMTSDENRMEVRRNWDMLMPREQIPISESENGF